MSQSPPRASEIEAIALELGLSLEPDEVDAYARLAAPFVGAADALDAAPDGMPPVRYPRTPGERPAPESNPLGAWYVKTRIEGAATGKLAGRTVVLKDNVMLAGVPMMNGTTLIDGYIPPVDATIVDRILDAGGIITGKATCEAFCLSGGSHTSDSGPVRNPHDPARHAGGSSSGSAALVAAGEVDLAIGGDQGGSIRMPSSFCGTVGMKATHGLVPYTGILALEATIDHVGPITANVADNALFLEVLAGPDGIDGRQAAPQVDAYCDSLERGADGLRIGILGEGFGGPSATPAVDAKVRDAATSLEQLGAKVGPISVPLHSTASLLLGPIFQAAFVQVLDTDGMGVGREDLYVPSLADHMRGWRERPDALPTTVKALLLSMEVLKRRHGWRYFAKAMNQVRRVRDAYDAALQEVDILLLPTTPMTAPLLPPADADIERQVGDAFAPVANTQPFNHSHHPAISLPCGKVDGMPVGLMLVGRAHEESTLYRAAQAFEQAQDWRTR
jgi:amidase